MTKAEKYLADTMTKLLQVVWQMLKMDKPKKEILGILEVKSFLLAVGRGENMLEELEKKLVALEKEKGVSK